MSVSTLLTVVTSSSKKEESQTYQSKHNRQLTDYFQVLSGFCITTKREDSVSLEIPFLEIFILNQKLLLQFPE